MKRLFYTAMLSLLAICNGCKNKDDLNILNSEGLGLYWAHTASVDRGRYLMLDFSNTKGSTDRYDYKFEYKIQGRVIDVRLADVISRGKCQVYPGPWGDQCASRGTIYISESELSEGTYQFRLQTGNSIVMSRLVVGRDEFEMIVLPNPHFTNYIPKVYAIPKNIIYGSVWYEGSDKEPLAKAFIDGLAKAGLKPATVPVHNYTGLPENMQQHLAKTSSEPDNHLIHLLFSYSGDFTPIVEICKKHFDQSGRQLGIGITTSDGKGDVTGVPGEEMKVFLP